MSTSKIKVGVSSCLMGEKVRHDGGQKRQPYLTEEWANYFEFVLTCPEVDIGLGVPRPTIRLIDNPKSPKMVFVKDNTIDITNKMQKYSQKRSKQLKHLCGYIFKKNSPTCGPIVKVYQPIPKPPKRGKGLFYETFCEAHPLVPVEDEGRLNDPNLRENFIERVYLMHRWQQANKKNLSAKKLVEFHTQHKLALMSHNVSAYRSLGRMIANIDKKNLKSFSEAYIAELMKAFKLIATKKKVSNVLYHCLGYLKNDISTIDKKEIIHQIEQYRLSRLPLIVPITLLKHHFMHHPSEYMSEQTFLNPYPDELMLRNRV